MILRSIVTDIRKVPKMRPLHQELGDLQDMLDSAFRKCEAISKRDDVESDDKLSLPLFYVAAAIDAASGKLNELF